MNETTCEVEHSLTVRQKHRTPTVEEAEAILTLVRGGWLKLELTLGDDLHTRSSERGTLGDDERCHRCGGANVTWFAPSPLWNLVMRGNDIEGDPIHHDLVCVPCFVILAEEVGVKGSWRLSVNPEPEGLIKITPSGRVWDEGKNLWVDPTNDESPAASRS